MRKYTSELSKILQNVVVNYLRLYEKGKFFLKLNC